MTAEMDAMTRASGGIVLPVAANLRYKSEGEEDVYAAYIASLERLLQETDAAAEDLHKTDLNGRVSSPSVAKVLFCLHHFILILRLSVS